VNPIDQEHELEHPAQVVLMVMAGTNAPEATQ
jgi:hypothetical protein